MKICVLFVALVSLVACGSPGTQQQGASLAKVTVDPTMQWVSIEAKDAPIEAILSEMGKQAHFTISLPNGMQLGRITLTVKNISLEEAIQKLLVGRSYQLNHLSKNNERKTLAGIVLQQDSVAHTSDGTSTDSARLVEQKHSAEPGRGFGLRGEPGTLSAEDQFMHVSIVMEDLAPDTIKQLMNEAQDPTLRVAILDAMKDREDQGAVQPLFLDSLQDGNAEVREAAIDYLQSSYEPLPMAPLVDLVGKEINPELRIAALSLLSDQMSAGDRTKTDLALAITSASLALADPNPEVRDQAELTLAELSQTGQASVARRRF